MPDKEIYKSVTNEQNREKETRVSLELARFYFRLMIVVAVLGFTTFAVAMHIGKGLPDRDTSYITSHPDIVNNNLQDVMTIYMADYPRNLKHMQSLIELYDRFDLPNQWDYFIESNRVLLLGIPDAEIGDGLGSHSVQEYRPFIYDTETEEAITLSDEQEIPMGFSPDGQYAVLESGVKNGKRWTSRFRIVRVGDDKAVKEVAESFIDFASHFHFSTDSKKLTIDTNHDSVVHYFNLETGLKTELTTGEYVGDDSIVYPDPVGEGIYYLDNTTRQIMSKNIQTGEVKVVMDNFSGSDFTLSPDAQVLIYKSGDNLMAYQINSQKLHTVPRVAEYVVEGSNVFVRYYTGEGPNQVLTFDELVG